MAILLTALSVNATTIEAIGDTQSNAPDQNQVDTISLGNAIHYFIDSSQQQLVGENEQESLPLTLEDSSFFLKITNYGAGNFSSVLEHSQRIAAENTSFSTYYTKQILFPFHSYW